MASIADGEALLRSWQLNLGLPDLQYGDLESIAEHLGPKTRCFHCLIPLLSDSKLVRSNRQRLQSFRQELNRKSKGEAPCPPIVGYSEKLIRGGCSGVDLLLNSSY